MHRSTSCHRAGALTVEFALCATLLFSLFTAAFELGRMNMIRHSVDVAAYEGARRGIVAGATAADVRAKVTELLTPINIRNVTVDVTPAVIDSETDRVTVNVQVPLGSNGIISPVLFSSVTATGSSTLIREGYTTR